MNPDTSSYRVTWGKARHLPRLWDHYGTPPKGGRDSSKRLRQASGGVSVQCKLGISAQSLPYHPRGIHLWQENVG